MRHPSPEDMERTADFLDAALSVDGTDADNAICGPVVAWLRAQAEAAAERAACREAGVPVGDLRRRMRTVAGGSS